MYTAAGTKAGHRAGTQRADRRRGRRPSFTERIAAETSPAGLIRLSVALNRSLHERCGDTIAAVRPAAGVDATLADAYATLADAYAEGTRRHDDGTRWVISKLKAAGALAARPGRLTGPDRTVNGPLTELRRTGRSERL